MRFLAAIALAAAASAQSVLVYDNGPIVTDPTGGFGGAPISALQTALPYNFFVVGFNANNAAAVRQTDEFTVNSSMSINDIEVFFYNTNITVPSCTGVFVSVFDGNPATGAPNQLIPGAGAATNLIGAPGFTVSNTMTGIYRVTTTTLTDTSRQVQSVRITLPSTLTLTTGTYYLQYSFTGTSVPFFPPITTLNTFHTGNAQQYNNGVYGPVQMTTPPTPGVPIPGAFQGIPFRFYGPAPAQPGAITPLGGGCSLASMAVKGAPVIGGHLRADLSNVNASAFGAIILGTTNVNAPAGVCACTFHPSLDFLSIGNAFELQIPLNGSLVGAALYVQGAQLDLIPIGSITNCNLGVLFDLTDAFQFRLNLN